MISLEHARGVGTERMRKSGSFPDGTGADALRRRYAAPLRRRDTRVATAKRLPTSKAYKLTRISWEAYAKATRVARADVHVVYALDLE